MAAEEAPRFGVAGLLARAVHSLVVLAMHVIVVRSHHAAPLAGNLTETLVVNLGPVEVYSLARGRDDLFPDLADVDHAGALLWGDLLWLGWGALVGVGQAEAIAWVLTLGWVNLHVVEVLLCLVAVVVGLPNVPVACLERLAIAPGRSLVLLTFVHSIFGRIVEERGACNCLPRGGGFLHEGVFGHDVIGGRRKKVGLDVVRRERGDERSECAEEKDSLHDCIVLL